MDTGIITLLVTNIVTPIIAWWFSKKKYYTEVDKNLIENMKEALEFYKKLSDDSKQRLNETLEELSKVIDQNRELVKRNAYFEQEISSLKTQMLDLSMNICLDLKCRNRILENKVERAERQRNGKKKNNESIDAKDE